MQAQEPLRLEILGTPPSPWFYTAVGFLLGVIAGMGVGYPLFIVVSTVHVCLYNPVPLALGRSLLHSLSPHNWPIIGFYAIAGGIFGGILGKIYQKLIASRLRVEQLYQEFELQVAALRHHYKNLVIGIQGFSHRIERDLKENRDRASLERDVTILSETAQRLSETLGNELILLKALTIESLNSQPHDIYPILVNSIQELLRFRFQEKTIRVEVNGRPWEECQDSLVFIFEPNAMEVILQNILSNAMKYGDHIQVAVTMLPDQVKIALTDNGPGLELESLEKHLPRAGERREADSTRLGLKVVLRLLEKFGGKLFIWSQPGAGSTFTLEFPRH